MHTTYIELDWGGRANKVHASIQCRSVILFRMPALIWPYKLIVFAGRAVPSETTGTAPTRRNGHLNVHSKNGEPLGGHRQVQARDQRRATLARGLGRVENHREAIIAELR